MSEVDTLEKEDEVETVETNSIEDLVNQITAGELNKAEGSFKDILDDKLAGALDAARVQVASGIFDKEDEDISDEDIEDITDEELEDEDLEDIVDQIMDEDEEILAQLEDDDIEIEEIDDEDVEDEE